MRLCSPELVSEGEARGAHHVEMLTGSRKQPYNASMYLENPKFRAAVPEPVVEMSETLGAALGLAAGDIAKLTTDYGTARFKVAFAKMRYSYMLPCTLPVFRQQFPNVRINVLEGHSEENDRKLLSGQMKIVKRLPFMTLLLF